MQFCACQLFELPEGTEHRRAAPLVRPSTFFTLSLCPLRTPPSAPGCPRYTLFVAALLAPLQYTCIVVSAGPGGRAAGGRRVVRSNLREAAREAGLFHWGSLLLLLQGHVLELVRELLLDLVGRGELHAERPSQF